MGFLLSVPFGNSDMCSCASRSHYVENGFSGTQERHYLWWVYYLAVAYQVECDEVGGSFVRRVVEDGRTLVIHLKVLSLGICTARVTFS